jgi:uncharacterized membrane protein (UPF0127 family)
MKFLSIVSVVVFLYATASEIAAQESSFNDAVVFSRQKLTINAIRLIEAPKPATNDSEENTSPEEDSDSVDQPSEVVIEEEEEDATETETQYIEQPVAYAFDVMVRPMNLVQAGSLQRLGWLQHDEGIMLTLEQTDLVSLADLGITTNIDVIFIRPNGIIDAIAPSITPEQMSAAIETRKPVNAALLLKAGMAEHLRLEPGNQVNHKHFQPDTTVLR